VQDLLRQMTLEEKTAQCATLYGNGRVLPDELPTEGWDTCIWKDGIANIDEQLNGITPTDLDFPYHRHAKAINDIQRWFVENTRLGVPVDFSTEGIHGLNHTKATALPAPIGIGSTWNVPLVYQAGVIEGKEAKALGFTNVYAPILDLARDPRWGRVLECYGEDPFLVTEMGAAMVNGIQSQGVASTLKHYAVYSVPKGGRDGYTRTDPHVAPRELHQLHLYPYRQIVSKCHPMGVMSSYNDWDGVPVTASYYFLTELLRHEYGFKGYIVSDSEAVEYVWNKHRVAPTYEDGVRQVAEAGLNVRTTFRPPSEFILPLRKLVKEGNMKEAVLDRNVADVLRVKFQLGLFDQPYVEDPKAADKIVHDSESKVFLERMGHESLVLLKNEKNTLPLELSKLNNILVTGPLAIDTTAYVSRYGPQHLEVTTVLEGIKAYVESNNTNKHKAKVHFSLGCEVVDLGWPKSELYPTPLTQDEQKMIDDAVKAAEKSDVVIAVVGEDEKRCGENKSRTSLDLPGRQRDLLQALHKTGKPMVVILINGQPLTINWTNDHVPAILEAWFPNNLGGKTIADAVFGAYNPGGKLPITFPKSTGQIEWNFPYKPWSHGFQAEDGPNGHGITSIDGELYPFGYGLSYTKFVYSELEISPEHPTIKDTIRVSFKVKNVGKRAGDEVAQVYFRDQVSSIMTYELQLRGFKRVHLKPNEIKELVFKLPATDFELLDKEMNWVTEPGKFDLWIGSSSQDIRLKQTFEMFNP
jgi:beta-glucosidase